MNQETRSLHSKKKQECHLETLMIRRLIKRPDRSPSWGHIGCHCKLNTHITQLSWLQTTREDHGGPWDHLWGVVAHQGVVPSVHDVEARTGHSAHVWVTRQGGHNLWVNALNDKPHQHYIMLIILSLMIVLLVFIYMLKLCWDNCGFYFN